MSGIAHPICPARPRQFSVTSVPHAESVSSVPCRRGCDWRPGPLDYCPLCLGELTAPKELSGAYPCSSRRARSSFAEKTNLFSNLALRALSSAGPFPICIIVFSLCTWGCKHTSLCPDTRDGPLRRWLQLWRLARKFQNIFQECHNNLLCHVEIELIEVRVSPKYGKEVSSEHTYVHIHVYTHSCMCVCVCVCVCVCLRVHVIFVLAYTEHNRAGQSPGTHPRDPKRAPASTRPCQTT